MLGLRNEKILLLIQQMYNSKIFRKRFIYFSLLVLISVLIASVFLPTISKMAQISKSKLFNAPISNIHSNNYIIKNGVPFFPLGFYHDSDTSPDWLTNKYSRLKALRNIAKAGFNIMHPSMGNIDNDVDITFLNEAQKLGVTILVGFTFQNFQGKTDVIFRHKGHPAILGWSIADDFNWPPNKITPDMVSKRNLEVKSVDPSHITYISGGSPLPNFHSYFHSADLIATQSYPIGLDMDGSGIPIQTPLRKNYDWMALATHDSRNQLYDKPIIANLQTFPHLGNRVPTGKEVRNMTYTAIINGVKGIIYYTSYYGASTQRSEWNLFEDKALWSEMKSLASEINALSPILLNGQLKKINTQLNDLFAAQWISNKKDYIVVINTSDTQRRKVSITLPLLTKVRCSAKPLFPGRPSGMILNNGKLEGIIEAGDVHVYKLTLTNTNC